MTSRFTRRQADYYNASTWQVYKNNVLLKEGLTHEEAGALCRLGNTGKATPLASALVAQEAALK